jgi:hypothetical protein
VAPPAGIPSGQYYDQLTNKFNTDISAANTMAAAAAEAVVQQASGERPFKTTYDAYFGDTVQQGIIIDKLASIVGFTQLWRTDNYDPTQAQGGYISSYSFGDASYATVSEQAVTSMVGGAYDIFNYAVPAAVLSFAQATHDVNFNFTNRPEVRDWVGGYVFYRLDDFLAFFRQLAVQNHFADETGNPCTSVTTCAYDPRIRRTQADPLTMAHSDTYNQFLGPDARRWIWTYVQDRNQWVAADRDRNVATYVILFNYNGDINYNEDDGNIGPAYQFQLPVKYFLDYFTSLN